MYSYVVHVFMHTHSMYKHTAEFTVSCLFPPVVIFFPVVCQFAQTRSRD